MRKVLAFISAILMVVSMLPLELIAKNEDFLSSNEIEVDFGDKVEDESNDNIFVDEEKSISIKRDYNQDAYVGLNINARGEYLFKINNPYDDLYIGFGTESEDVIMTMGYSNSLPFKINAQNAESVNYEIYIEAWEKDILKERTKVNISVDNNGLNIDLSHNINDKGQVELSITNEGYDSVADLSLSLSPESSKYFSAQKDLTNYYLYSNSSVSALLVPNFEELKKLDDKNFIIKFEITGAAQKREFEINYDFSNSTIEKKTVKEILEDMHEDEPSNPEDPEDEEKWLPGKYDFPDGVLTFADINEWPEEISIEVDKLQILDNNEYLVKYNLTTFDVELNNQGSEEETLSNSDTYKEINIKLPVQKLIFELTDKEGKTYQRILRVKKPTREIEMSEDVVSLDSDHIKAFVDCVVDDSTVVNEDGIITMTLNRGQELYDSFAAKKYKVDDVIFVPDYDDGENVFLESYLKVISIENTDDKIILDLRRAEIDEIIKYDENTLIDAHVLNGSDLMPKYIYNINDGFKILNDVQSDGITMMRASKKKKVASFESEIDYPKVSTKVELSDRVSLSFNTKSFIKYKFDSYGSKSTFELFGDKYYSYTIKNTIFQQGDSKIIEFMVDGKLVNMEKEEETKKLKDILMDDNTGESLIKKMKEGVKNSFKISGINYDNRIVIAAVGKPLTGGVTTWKNKKNKKMPVILWTIVYLDIDGNFKISYEYGNIRSTSIEKAVFACVKDGVDLANVGISRSCKPKAKIGKISSYFYISPKKPIEEEYKFQKVSGEAKVEIEFGFGCGLMVFGKMIGDASFGITTKANLKVSCCNADPEYFSEAGGRLLSMNDTCPARGKICIKGSITSGFFIKGRVEIGIKIFSASKKIKFNFGPIEWEFLNHNYIDTCKEPDDEGEPEPREGKEHLDDKLDTDDKEENDKNKIPSPKHRKGSSNKPKIGDENNLPSYEIHQQGEQCINARVREWDWSIPLFDKLNMFKNQPMPSIETFSLYTVSENDQNSHTVDLLSTNKEEYSLFNDIEINNESDKVEAYLVSKITLDDIRKNKFEEFRYIVNGKAVGKESLDLGGHQIYKIKEGILSPGKNVMVQKNSYTNRGSARMQSDTRLIIPLPLDQEIYTYNGKPVLDIAAPYVDFAVDTDSAKFKNPYPGLVDSIHTIDIRVLNVGTKTDYANICLVEDIDGDSRNLDVKRVKISAMDQIIEEFKFYRKPGANYLVEVYDDKGSFDDNPENNSSAIRIEEFDKSKITPEVNVVNNSFREDQKYTLAVYAKSPVGARIKTIIAYNEGKEIARRDLETISYNDSYDLMKSDSLIKFDKIVAIDEYGTIGEKSFKSRMIQIKLPSEANEKHVVGRVNYSWIDNKIDDGIINVETYSEETGGILSYDNKFLGFKSKDDFIDLTNTKFSEMKIVKGPGVNVESISAVFEESIYRSYVNMVEPNQDSIFFSPGKFNISITYSKDGVYSTIYKFLDTENIEDIKLGTEENGKYAYIKVDAPDGINYYAYADGMRIPKEGIKLSDEFIKKDVYVVVDDNGNRINYKQKIKEGDNIIKIRPAVFKLEDDYSVEFNNVTIKCSEISNNDIPVDSLEGYFALITDVNTGEKTYARVSYYKGNCNIRIYNRDYKGNLITGKKKVRLIFNGEYEYNKEEDKDYIDPGYRYDPSPDYLNNRDRDDKIVVRQPGREEKKEDILKTLYFYLDKYFYEMELNGNISQIPMDVAPTAINQRTMLPIRFVAEAIGATVEWHQDTQSATFTKNGITATITLGSNIIQVSDGRQIVLDAEPAVVDQRIFVPLTNISQIFGLTNGDLRDGNDNDIEWDQENYRVIITVRENQ